MKAALNKFVFVFILVVSSHVGASSLIALDLDTLARDAKEIFVGEVVSARAEIRGKQIFTIHTVRVLVPIAMEKAFNETLVEVVTAGGSTAQFAQMVIGEAELHQGGIYLLFLSCRDFERVPMGLSQGAYRVRQRDAPGALVVVPPTIGARLLTLRNGRFVDTGPWLSEPKPLGEIIAEIQALREVER